MLCGAFTFFLCLQTYQFIFPKATKSPESHDPMQYFCQAIYSPNLSLSTHLQLLPAVLKYCASLAFHHLLVFGQSMWFTLQCILFHQVCAVTHFVLSVLHCTSSCSWLPGIALLHQLACLWYFVMVWLHQVSTYLPSHALHHFEASRPSQCCLAQSGWAWKLFCASHFICWMSSMVYQGCTLSYQLASPLLLLCSSSLVFSCSSLL